MKLENENDYDTSLGNHELNKYKGIFYNSKAPPVLQDPATGAHFNYHDMCRRLTSLKRRNDFFRAIESDEDLSEADECEVAEENPKPDVFGPYKVSLPKKLITTLLANPRYPSVIHTWTKGSTRNINVKPSSRIQRKEGTPYSLHTMASDKRLLEYNPSDTKKESGGIIHLYPAQVEKKYMIENGANRLSRNVTSSANYSCWNKSTITPSDKMNFAYKTMAGH